MLKTLGGLSLEGSSFTRAKPLLVLAYLAIEGRTSRRELADLFFTNTKNPRDSLATAIKQLRKENNELLIAEKTMLSTTLECDAVKLLEATNQLDIQALDRLYEGAFLKGISLELGTELEEWVYGIRDYLLEQVQNAYIRQADALASQGKFDLASQEAEKVAFTTLESLEPDALFHLHALLLAGGSSEIEKVRKESLEFSLPLLSSESDAKQYLQEQLEGIKVKSVSSLPKPETGFLGRSVELAELKALFEKPECRLLTILGWGGVGKTRLSLRLAQHLLEEASVEDGVYFVALEGVATVDLFASSIASVLGITLTGKDALIVQLANYVNDKHLVLVLDNFEHLIEASSQLDVLLTACPNIKVLLTSREALNLRQEWRYQLEGLAIPKIKSDWHITQNESSLELFVQRAQKVHAKFTLTDNNVASVIKILELVGGSPLGIELAASWVYLLDLEEIAKEISSNLDILTSHQNNDTDRHKSLRATFEYSWQRLTNREQEQLKNLSVFAGGFTRDAAQAIASIRLPELSRFIEKSLIQQKENNRFQSHPLLKQFAFEKLSLNEQEQREAEHRHASFFAEQAKKENAKFNGPEHKAGFAFFENNIDNLRAVLEWCIKNEELAIGLTLVSNMGLYWRYYDDPVEANNWYGRYSSLDISESLASVQGEALLWAAFHGNYHGDIKKASRLFEESLACFEKVDNYVGCAKVYSLWGHMYGINSDNPSKGEKYLRKAISIAKDGGDTDVLSYALVLLGQNLVMQVRMPEAQAMFEEALSLASNYPKNVIGTASAYLGTLYLINDNYAAARIYTQRGVDAYTELHYPANAHWARNTLTIVDVLEGKTEDARKNFVEMLTYFEQFVPPWMTSGILDEVAFWASVVEHDELAATLAGHLFRLRNKQGVPASQFYEERHSAAHEKVKNRMSEGNYSYAWHRGETMNLKEAVQYALEELKSY